MIGVSILGSTGSVGTSTLDVVGRHPERFRVVALTGNRNVQRMADQCRQFGPALAVMVDPTAARSLERSLGASGCATTVLAGSEALVTAATLDGVDAVMAAIVGAAGLAPTLAAARAGRRVLLANKEALVMAGHLFMNQVRTHGAVLLPIDSEHNALFQCLPAMRPGGLKAAGVARLLLTGSGGPFRTLPVQALAAVTPEQACAHPNWVMGRKISVDSATMMNKGLEVIEAHWLFDAPSEQIEVVVHPQSVIHSMVEYVDGSVIAQLGNPDMRTPIAHALAWPERIAAGVPQLNLPAIGRLDFEPPDEHRFPCLALARQALHAGASAPAVLNAANEVAVHAFLERGMPFPSIAAVIGDTLTQVSAPACSGLEALLEVDRAARAAAERLVTRQMES